MHFESSASDVQKDDYGSVNRFDTLENYCIGMDILENKPKADTALVFGATF